MHTPEKGCWEKKPRSADVFDLQARVQRLERLLTVLALETRDHLYAAQFESTWQAMEFPGTFRGFLKALEEDPLT
jgi:hypothetical protein